MYYGRGDLSPIDLLGARLIVTRMLTEGEILWQIFLRGVDSETIFLNRCPIVWCLRLKVIP